MKRLLCFVFAVTLGGIALAQTPPYGTPPILRAPASGMVMTYTIGTITVGGWQIIIPAGSVTILDNEYSCNAPPYPACNSIYWAGPGLSLSSTTDPRVAFSPGVAAIGFVTTKGGVVQNIVYRPTSTQMVPPSLVGATIGLRLPICNAVLKTSCQVAIQGSLSGY